MEELKDEIKKEITIFMEKTLDLVQVAVPEGNWRAMRSKILRSGNDCIRNTTSFLENYQWEE